MHRLREWPKLTSETARQVGTERACFRNPTSGSLGPRLWLSRTSTLALSDLYSGSLGPRTLEGGQGQTRIRQQEASSKHQHAMAYKNKLACNTAKDRNKLAKARLAKARLAEYEAKAYRKCVRKFKRTCLNI